jgi:phage shock protein A
MGLFSRMSTIVKSKMNRILDNAEDPRETLDYSYEKQMEMLRNVKRGVIEMVTAKRRLELQAAKVQENITKLDDQARQALAAGREDLARLALQRKQASLQELQGLDQQIAGLELEQEKLTNAEQRLQAKVAAFRTKKEIIKAQYGAAQAQVRIGEALSGVSEEMGDVALAIDRAENKTEQLRARAGAIDELATAGVLEDFSGRQDDIGRELAQLTASQNVESELAALKASLPGGKAQGELPPPSKEGPAEGQR